MKLKMITSVLVLNTSGGDVSEIAAPARLYPEGVDFALSGVEGCAVFDAERGRLGVRAVQAGELIFTFGPATVTE